jgi:23S rRNA (cytosine1962-C5)-methyltransferase
VFSNEIAMRPEYRRLQPGIIVRLDADDGSSHGAFMFNPHSLIAARRLDRDPDAALDDPWLRRRIGAAIALRERVVADPRHCRLIHAEADGLPGLIVDRYGDVAVMQANTAGMDLWQDRIASALMELLGLRAVVARNDSSARRQEGLEDSVRLLAGTDATAEAVEGGVRFPVDPLGGQKTGFFYDQRPNRNLVAQLAKGARVLDVFCHTGGFGVRSAAAGAAEVTLVDGSQPALDAAMIAAEINGVVGQVRARRGDAFDVLADLASERFDIVVTDPPAFAKSKKDAEAGLRAYRRLARLAATLVAPGGFLFTASCSYHAPLDAWAAQIGFGLARARRDGRVLHTGGAGPDHPVHPHLPETAYLKAQLLQLD